MKTISPWSNKYSGPYILLSLDPTQKAPPWINTITGKVEERIPGVSMGIFGVNMFRYKQSSWPNANLDSGAKIGTWRLRIGLGLILDNVMIKSVIFKELSNIF